MHHGPTSRIVLAGMAAAALLPACSDGDQGAATSTTVTVRAPVSDEVAPWQQLVDRFATDSPGVPGVALAVIAPDVDVAVAAGFGDLDQKLPLTPAQPFRIASNTKTFTAAATLRLVEDGAIALADPIADRLDPILLDLLEDDGYDTASITVEHLLLHTSGLYDYASDVDYQTLVLGDISQHWQRYDQVRFAVEHGDPLGEPGTQYAYSDSGYVLLGDLIERSTGKSLAAAFRDLLHFDDLGLNGTWLETIEPEPPGVADRAHQFYEDLDTYDGDPSFDLYGGGGLVSTVGDLATFYRALVGGQVFTDPATLAVMTTIPPVNSDAGAAMGLFRFDSARLGDCWSHSGFWGSVVITCPDTDFTFAMSVLQASPDPAFAGDALLEQAAGIALDGN